MPHTTGYTSKYRGQATLDAIDAYISGGWREIEGHVWPSLQGCAQMLGVNAESFRNWAYKHRDFELKYQELKQFCESMLVQGGLAERYNPAFAKFLLSARFNYAEKTIVDSQSSDGSMSPKATLDVSLLDDGTLKAIMAAQRKQSERDEADRA